MLNGNAQVFIKIYCKNMVIFGSSLAVDSIFWFNELSKVKTFNMSTTFKYVKNIKKDLKLASYNIHISVL